jgi:hypothetical protein
MVKTNGQVALLATIHNELLNHGRGDFEWRRELSELSDEAQLYGLVHLGKLLEKSSKDDLLQRKDIFLHLGIGANLREDGGDLLAD